MWEALDAPFFSIVYHAGAFSEIVDGKGSRSCIQKQNCPVQTPLYARLGVGIQCRYKANGDEKSCLVPSGPNLALGSQMNHNNKSLCEIWSCVVFFPANCCKELNG